MTPEPAESIAQPTISRRDIAKTLAGDSSGDPGVDRVLADLQRRARLVRATPRSLQTLLVFSSPKGLLLVPYHPDPLRAVDCVVAHRDLAMATWLGTVQPPPLSIPRPINSPMTLRDEVTPRVVLQDTVLGETDTRQALSLEVHPKAEPGWQVLCVTGISTKWGFGKLNTKVNLQHTGIIGLWALLRQVVIPMPPDSAGAGFLGDLARSENLVQSDRIKNQVGGRQ